MGRKCPLISWSVLLYAALTCGLWGQKGLKKDTESRPPAGWTGRTEISNGIRTVVNPDKPLFGEFTFDLENDLILGDENVKEKAFLRPWPIQVDEQGCIYAVDYDASCIRKFDPSGRHLLAMGRKGQGPGEFDYLFRFFVAASGQISAGGSPMTPKIEVFDPKGTFVKQISTGRFYDDFFVTSKGDFVADILEGREDGKQEHVLVQADPAGKVIRTICRFPDSRFRVQPGLGTSGYKYSNEFVFRPRNAGSYAYGFSSEYKIVIMDTEGRKNMIIAMDEKPVLLSRKEKDIVIDEVTDNLSESAKCRISKSEVAKNISLPDHKPFFADFFFDDHSRLYVKRFQDPLKNRGKAGSVGCDYDVFDKNGIYIYRLKLPYDKMIIKKGYLYRTESDESSGLFRILRHKIRNYGGMKGF